MARVLKILIVDHATAEVLDSYITDETIRDVTNALMDHLSVFDSFDEYQDYLNDKEEEGDDD